LKEIKELLLNSINEKIFFLKILQNLSKIEKKIKKISKSNYSKFELEKIKIDLLGKKSILFGSIKQMLFLKKKYKPRIGILVNSIKSKMIFFLSNTCMKQNFCISYNNIIEEIDISLPGKIKPLGSFHPINIVLEKIIKLLKNFGFKLNFGPQIEFDFFNFKALNMHKNHPARDMQDTFYVEKNIMLRTHTSSVQIREMADQKIPPIKIMSFGPVYRRDYDATHLPMFHQIEALNIDEGVSFFDLIKVLKNFIKNIFSNETKMRFRPSYFPFTLPSVEIDIGCFLCKNSLNCKVCKGTGWIEIMGAGMVDLNVLKKSFIDFRKYSGFAFGIGVERIAMLIYKIEDMRIFYENDLRFLSQFNKL
jgi:phenylalanyl-tRNA synthetase alpha chain